MAFSTKKELDSIFQDFFKPIIDFASLPIDTVENSREFVIKADVPGIKKSDISVTHENNVISISAFRPCQEPLKDSDSRNWLERPCGDMKRTIRLPQGIDEASMTANVVDGVLTITASKSSTPPSKINIL